MIIIAARPYVSLRQAPLTLHDAETRNWSYWLKDPATADAIFDAAAREMAVFVQTPCWLVPIPSCTGDTKANAILAAHIARHVAANQPSTINYPPVCQIALALRRTRPIESQCSRHRRNLPATPVEEHHLAATGRALGTRQVYFVDNVATSGHTMRAAFEALGRRGAGLVFSATAHINAISAPDPDPTLF